jgi:hypothetical protein
MTVHRAMDAALDGQGARPRAPLPSPVRHSYGTRIRQNSIIKPSARLRQSPDPPTAPRRIKPVPSSKPDIMSSDQHVSQDMPAFPPPHVILHPEDANSKIFLAIGRSFLSVENRAMTIKDLADMTMNFGLVCQNVSAAGQAITTYIRNHMQRCESQGDHPLLLRHILSGTSSDDELLPALHSRTGGAHCTVNPEHRSTNFRRGTMVWYLSRATGVPCPFTRAGIRLCEYGESGKVGVPNGSRERKRERDRLRRSEQCGQKRKRQLRGYKGSDHESSEEGKKPPKVKLTLRLRPCGMSHSSPSESMSSGSANVIDLSKESDSDDSGDDIMSLDSSSDEEEEPVEADAPWSLPPYPKRSISIPCYTPSVESTFLVESPSYSVASPSQGFVRSSSVPFSVASPPPDSEDEDDDYHISMTGSCPFYNDVRPTPETDPDWDLDFDSDGERGETETQWESPCPRSPSAPLAMFEHDVLVKQEPKDIEGVQGMLDHWEPLDSNIDGNRVVEVVAKAAAGLIDDSSSVTKVKVEELELWDWEENYSSAKSDWYRQSEDEQEAIHIKQEDIEPDSALILGDESLMSPTGGDYFSPCSPTSPYPPSPSHSRDSPVLSVSAPGASGLRRNSELTWKDVELLGPDSVHLHEFEDGEWQEGNGNRAVRMRAKTQPSLPTFEAGCNFSLLSSTRRPEVSATSAAQPSGGSGHVPPDSIVQPPALPVQTRISPGPLRGPVLPPPVSTTPAEPQPDETESCQTVVVHTCQPCTPAITATQVEGISVYQMTFGSSPLFRRIDTDFVNLSPIVAYLGILPTSCPGAVVVNQGTAFICGTWVPLASAQSFVRQHPLPNNLLDTFLSDLLFERFPSALQDFHRSNAPGRLLSQFGPHFRSTLGAKRHSQSILRNEAEVRETDEPWEGGLMSHWEVEDHLLSTHPPFSLALAALRRSPEEDVVPETPLSPTEQEMFQTLCAMPDWEKENLVPPSTVRKEVPTSKHVEDGAENESASALVHDQPRRRSKRVANANAIASRTRARSQKRNSHNSLA